MGPPLFILHPILSHIIWRRTILTTWYNDICLLKLRFHNFSQFIETGHDFSKRIMERQNRFLYELHTAIDQHFNLSEIHELCFILDIDFEHLVGEERRSKIWSLIFYCVGSEWEDFKKLLTQLSKSRPSVKWPNPPDFPTLKKEAGAIQKSVTNTKPINISDLDINIQDAEQVNITYHSKTQYISPNSDLIIKHLGKLTQKHEIRRWSDESPDDYFIPSTSKIRPLFTKTFFEDSISQKSELMDMIKQSDRLIILGEAGTGKTTALRRTMWEIAYFNTEIVPIYLPLRSLYSEILEAIRIALMRTKVLRFNSLNELRHFLHEQQCIFLFDGLNELPKEQKSAIVGKFDNFISEFPNHQYIFTSRLHDKTWQELQSSEVVTKATEIQLITNIQAINYLNNLLGRSGSESYYQLSEPLRQLLRIPLYLWMLKEVQATKIRGESLPKTQGELFETFIEQSLVREEKLDFNVRDNVKKDALINIAFNLHLLQETSCKRNDAKNWLESMFFHEPEIILGELLNHGLLKSDGNYLSFFQQSMQEYFVAIKLDEILSEYYSLKQRWNERVKGIPNNLKLLTAVNISIIVFFLSLTLLSTNTVYYPLFRTLSTLLFFPLLILILIWLTDKFIIPFKFQKFTKWAENDWWIESFLFLAGLTEHNSFFLQNLLKIKRGSWLAFLCMIESRNIDKETQSLVESKSFNKLHSDDVKTKVDALKELARIRKCANNSLPSGVFK